jgi:3-hydroxyisobutyrate dehydrogenase-like beta-hydroxyacid dehydrogenase
VSDGIDPHVAADVMTASAIGSPMLKARVPLVLDRPDETWFDIGFMRKDVRLSRAAAHDLDVPLASADLADELLGRAVAQGYEHRDIAALFELLGRSVEAG